MHLTGVENAELKWAAQSGVLIDFHFYYLSLMF